ncbi:MAG: helix-turn-helix transcriptional regulator [Gemmatimonadetes bacterium]|nr:helix-turn-helix transcriptional regulator [Gemmatimonadota bacterium]
MATLRPIEFEILLSLVREERHGYAIIQDIAGRSGETVETGTLYRALQRLTEGDLARPVAQRRSGPGDDERRQYYAITSRGRQAASAEARRLSALVDAARDARLLPRAT